MDIIQSMLGILEMEAARAKHTTHPACKVLATEDGHAFEICEGPQFKSEGLPCKLVGVGLYGKLLTALHVTWSDGSVLAAIVGGAIPPTSFAIALGLHYARERAALDGMN